MVSSLCAVRPWNLLGISTYGVPVMAAMLAMMVAVRAGVVFKPVPTAVPPSGNANNCDCKLVRVAASPASVACQH